MSQLMKNLLLMSLQLWNQLLKNHQVTLQQWLTERQLYQMMKYQSQ